VRSGAAHRPRSVHTASSTLDNASRCVRSSWFETESPLTRAPCLLAVSCAFYATGAASSSHTMQCPVATPAACTTKERWQWK
jgi:hypothetical protein